MQFLGWFFMPVVVQRQARLVLTVQSGGVAGAVPAAVDVPGLGSACAENCGSSASAVLMVRVSLLCLPSFRVQLLVRVVGLLAFLNAICCAGLLASLRRSQALFSPALSQVDDMFESNFVPHRRVISCDSDLDSLHSVGPSVFGSSVSSRFVSSVSGFCGACVGEGGAGCGVRSEHVGDCVNLEGDLSGHNSWKHGHETAGGTKMLTQSSGYRDGCSFVDTVIGGAAREQYLRGAPKGTKVEAWEGRIFTCSRTISWDVSVAEGCKVTVSAVYLPKKRPGYSSIPAPRFQRGAGVYDHTGATYCD